MSDPSHDRPTSPLIRLVLAGVLASVSLVCAGLLGWLLVSDDGASRTQDAREEVMSITDQFVKRLGAYGPDQLDDSGQMPEYREQVTEVITDKFAADFEGQVEAVEQLVAQAGVERDTSVFATGVSSVDEDSARVLVAGSFNDTYTQESKSGEPRTITQEPLPFRFSVDLVKVEGKWLVDDFTPVSAEGDPAEGTPSE